MNAVQMIQLFLFNELLLKPFLKEKKMSLKLCTFCVNKSYHHKDHLSFLNKLNHCQNF